MKMTYDGALVMPMGCAMMDDEEMTYVDGGMKGKTKTAEDRISIASFVAAAAVGLGKLTVTSFEALAATACTGVLAFFNCLGSAGLLAATEMEGVLAGIAAGYAAAGKNYSYTCYGFGSFSIYTSISA